MKEILLQSRVDEIEDSKSPKCEHGHYMGKHSKKKTGGRGEGLTNTLNNKHI